MLVDIAIWIGLILCGIAYIIPDNPWNWQLSGKFTMAGVVAFFIAFIFHLIGEGFKWLFMQ